MSERREVFRATSTAIVVIAVVLIELAGGSSKVLSESSPSRLALIPQPRKMFVRPACTIDAAGLLLQLWIRRKFYATYERQPNASDRAEVDAVVTGIDMVEERWSQLGIAKATSPTALRLHGAPGRAGFVNATIAWSARSDIAPQGYRLKIDTNAWSVAARDADGLFYAFATLAQLARRGSSGRWSVPCVAIDDAPAMRWRILSDDVSRGPLPTMDYFKERIRTIAAFKMNGYSPYMEHVFLDPKHPLPAPLDGITPAQLRELAQYAARYRVALVPEQQTFAHMHETLRWERYAPLAESPHGYLLSPENPAGEDYVRDLIADELQAVPHPPFFHIGSDEPSDLGRGLSKAMVGASGDGPVYAKHVADTASYVLAHGGGARPMIWDDALERHPELFSEVPRQLVFVNWHYGSERSYLPYIDRIASGGFDQMVAPGALNWNQIYPDLDAALGNIGTFVNEGKSRRVLGLFQTVWHDDGETLFEATWYPVLFSAANAWEAQPVDRARFAADFPHAFFGSDDGRYASDFEDLALAGKLVRDNPREYGDYLFWSDPFESDLRDALAPQDAANLRLAAERAIAHLKTASPPPLHANAARVMEFAALRYDLLGRDVQIANEARAEYDLARANYAKGDSYVYRNLLLAKYLFWEQRDRMLELLPLARATWEYEDRASHEESVLERYRSAARLADARANALDDTIYRDYVQHHRLPGFDVATGLRPVPAPSPAVSPDPIVTAPPAPVASPAPKGTR